MNVFYVLVWGCYCSKSYQYGLLFDTMTNPIYMLSFQLGIYPTLVQTNSLIWYNHLWQPSLKSSTNILNYLKIFLKNGIVDLKLWNCNPSLISSSNLWHYFENLQKNRTQTLNYGIAKYFKAKYFKNILHYKQMLSK